MHEDCYLCGSDVPFPGPPVCAPCLEMVSRGRHGLSLDRPVSPVPLGEPDCVHDLDDLGEG